jgi:hypothetical protein
MSSQQEERPSRTRRTWISRSDKQVVSSERRKQLHLSSIKSQVARVHRGAAAPQFARLAGCSAEPRQEGLNLRNTAEPMSHDVNQPWMLLEPCKMQIKSIIHVYMVVWLDVMASRANHANVSQVDHCSTQLPTNTTLPNISSDPTIWSLGAIIKVFIR